MTIIQAEKKIRNAWIVGLISGFLTLLATLMAATSEGGAIDVVGTTFSAWQLIDVFLIFTFAFGIYMKNRVAAIGLFIYFLYCKLAMWGAAFSAASPSVLPMILTGIAALYFYFEGARGAIAYHRLRSGKELIPSPLASYVYPMSATRLRKRAWLTVLLVGAVLVVVIVTSVMFMNPGMVIIPPLDLVVIAGIVGSLAWGGLAALHRVGAPPLAEDGPVDRSEKIARARALRAAHGRRLGAILIAFSVLIFPVGIMLSAAAMAMGIGTGIIFPPLMFMAASATLLMRGRRMRAKDVKVLESDPRPPIVYLRPFAIDRENRKAIAPDSFRGRTAEQEMERALRGIAPFVALGDPTEDLPELGAVRLYADDVEWQKTVEELTKRAGTIILHAAGDSGGLAWEVQHVVSLGQPERIVLVRGVSYYQFCNAFAHLFPRGLLKYVTATSQYLYFDADWMPRSFDGHSTIEACHDNTGEQREQVLRRLIKDCP